MESITTADNNQPYFINKPTAISHDPSTQRYNYTSMTNPAISTSLGAKIAKADEDKKEIMNKDEIDSLRNSVLRTTRPKNPWFDQAEKSNGGVVIAPIVNPTKTAPARPHVQYSKHSYVPNECIRAAAAKKQPPAVKKADFPAPRSDDPTFLTADLKMLEQLESESMMRRARIGGGTSAAADPDPSPSLLMINGWPDLSLSPASSNYSSNNSTTTHSNSYSNNRHSSSISAKNNNIECCTQCKRGINDMVLHAMGSPYHPECFRCQMCYSCLDGTPFVIDNDGHMYCMEDYERSFIPACAKCQKAITRSSKDQFGQLVRIVLHDKEYHVECYTCEGCDLQLGNETNNRCYPIREHLLCRTCNWHWKQYGAVDQPITDL